MLDRASESWRLNWFCCLTGLGQPLHARLSSQTRADRTKWDLFKCKQPSYLQIKLNLSWAGWHVSFDFLGYSWIAWLFFRWLYQFNAKTVSMATYQVWKGAFPPPHTLMPGIGHGDVICDGSYSSVAAVKTIWLDGFHFCHHYLPVWSPATAFT